MRAPAVAFALALILACRRDASGQLATAPDANPLGAWHGTSRCVTAATDCRAGVISYEVSRMGRDSLVINARNVVGGREEQAESLACELNASRAYITCAVANGKWRFRVRHDSLVGQFRLGDGTWFLDVQATRGGRLIR